MSNEIYGNGTKVTVDEGKSIVTYTITGYDKGWYSTKEGKKIRHNRIAHVEVSKGKGKENDYTATMGQELSNRREDYFATVAASGKKSLNNGDTVANMLAGMEVDEVVSIAESLLNLPEDELAMKYKNLNVGQRRMNAGNRIRAALRRGEISEKDITKAIMG